MAENGRVVRTFADSVLIPEDGALFNLAERLEHFPHVVFIVLLAQHTDKQLSFCN